MSVSCSFTNKKHGFTLIELSIVLVIIGLIVGGILVGQQMIRSSELRAATTQLTKFSLAVNTFRSKYGGMPGDLKLPEAFGFDSGRLANLNGNSIIESAGAISVNFQEETSCFWDDLTFANLVSEPLNQAASCEAAQSPVDLGSAIPRSRVGQSNYITVGAVGGINYFWLTGVNSIAAGVYDFTDNLSATDAFEIDAKIDDSVPTQGTVQAYAGNTAQELYSTVDVVAPAAEGVCVISTGYNFITSGGNDTGCQLRIKTQF